jgi:hypothetical protein
MATRAATAPLPTIGEIEHGRNLLDEAEQYVCGLVDRIEEVASIGVGRDDGREAPPVSLEGIGSVAVLLYALRSHSEDLTRYAATVLDALNGLDTVWLGQVGPIPTPDEERGEA